MTLEFRQAESDGKGTFTAWEGETLAAEMTYSRTNPSLIIVNHTEVVDAFKGRGVGKELVAWAVRWVREHGQKILPLCPFTRRMFERTPAYADIWFR